MRKTPIFLSATLLAGCSGLLPASMQKGASLILTPQIQDGRYQTQATVSVYTSANIDHLTIKLFEGATELVSKTIFQGDLNHPITFNHLRVNTTYTVKSYAYLADNTQISLDGGSSRVFTTTSDDRPTILSLPVLLSDVLFNGKGTGSIQVTQGGLITPSAMELEFPYLMGAVKVNVEGRGDSFTARLFQANGGAEVATATSTSANPTFVFNNLAKDTNYNVWVEAYKSSEMFASQSVPLNLGSQDVLANLALSVPYVVSTLAGVANSAGYNDGSPGTFSTPFGVAVDGAGNLYVGDMNNHLIRKITPNGVVSTLAGVVGSHGANNGSPGKFYQPTGVAVDGAGNVYVGDTSNHLIRKITPDGVVSTLAGVAGQTGTSDGSPGTFKSPYGVAVDGAGYVYVADKGNHLIRKITPDGVVSTLAGVAGQTGSDNGSPGKFNSPFFVAVDRAGYVYVGDTSNHLIRKITPGGVVSTLAGVAGGPGSDNGIGTAAKFNNPYGVVVDGAGYVYVGDCGSYLIRKITPGGVVSTLAGVAGQSGTSDGIPGTFNYPKGVAVDRDGYVYVADTSSHLVRKLR